MRRKSRENQDEVYVIRPNPLCDLQTLIKHSFLLNFLHELLMSFIKLYIVIVMVMVIVIYIVIQLWLYSYIVICTIYNMSGRVVSDIQTRAEGESLYIRYNMDGNVVNDLKKRLIL